MHGWRARVGVLTVSSDTTTEPEYGRAFPDGVSVHASRLLLPEGSLDEEGIEAMHEEVERETEKLATAGVDVIAFALTSGSFIKGLEFARRIESRIESIGGVPAVAAAPSATRALDALGAESVAVHTPYVESIDEQLVSFLTETGFDVVDVRGLGLETDEEIGARTPESVYREVRRLDLTDADAVFVSCTGYRTLEAIEPLEADLGLPVVTANQASIWDALRTVGIDDPAMPLGTLFDHDGHDSTDAGDR